MGNSRSGSVEVEVEISEAEIHQIQSPSSITNAVVLPHQASSSRQSQSQSQKSRANSRNFCVSAKEIEHKYNDFHQQLRSHQTQGESESADVEQYLVLLTGELQGGIVTEAMECCGFDAQAAFDRRRELL